MVCGLQLATLIIHADFAVKTVSTGLCDDIDDGASGVSVFGGMPGGFDLNFFVGIHGLIGAHP